MVSNEVWMDSGAMVSMIPEQDIFLGAFVSGVNSDTSTGAIASATVKTAGTELLASQTIIDNASIIGGEPASGTGAELLLGLSKHSSTLTFAANNGTNYEEHDEEGDGFITLYIAGAEGTEQLAVRFDEGVESSSATGADKIITIPSSAIPSSGSTGSQVAEVVLQALRDEDVTVTRTLNVLTITNNIGGYVDDTEENTFGGVLVSSQTSTRGGEVLSVTVTSGGSGFSLASGNDVTITSTGTNAVIEVALVAVPSTNAVFTLNPSFTAELLLVPNLYRGCILEFYLDTSDNTFTDKAMIISNTANTITVANTIDSAIMSSASSYYGVIQHIGAPVPAPKDGSNPRLLSDTWIGLTDQVTVPQTQIEMKTIALNSGSRSMAYQFKGAETTSGGSFTLSANNFSWLYYALGSKEITTVSNESPVTMTSDDFFTSTGLTGNNFIYDSNVNTAGFHRTIGNVVCPPLNKQKGMDDTDIKSVNLAQTSGAITNKITYTFSENNSADLPSFALEYTLKKPASMATEEVDITETTVNGVTRDISETVYSKIYPGCQVESVNLTADAGQEMKMTVNFNSKNTFTAPNNYVTANKTTDLQEWVNFGSPAGGQSSISEEQLRPFFFSDGTIEMFGQEYIRIENMTLDIANSLQPKRFIGRYDKNSQTHIPGQRTYNLSFTGLVTDNLLFEEMRNNAATSLSGTDGNQIKLTFTKDTATNDETLSMVFKDYMVVTADFPLTNDKGPITVNWSIVPLELHSCTHTTNWIIQG